jgi:hypothetical protein
MNKHDKDNLRFLLCSSNETITDWFHKTSEDDILYAMELLNTAQVEMSMQLLNDEVKDLTDANNALKKFML